MRLHTFLPFLLSSPSVATPWPQSHDSGVPHSPVRLADDSSAQQPVSAEDEKKSSLHHHQQQAQKHRTLVELRDTLDVLQQTWFDLSRGTWPTSIDWTGAVLNTHLIAASNTLSHHHDDFLRLDNLVNHYFAQTSAYYYGENAASLRHQAYDDMLWVVLSWLESTRFIESYSHWYHDGLWHGHQFVPVFARRAKSFYNITTNGWSDELCNGGMTWNPALEPYKNAITNELFISASVGIYLYFPHSLNTSSFSKPTQSRRDFLHAAIAGYDWLTHSNMTDKQHLFVDGFHITGWNKNGTGGKTCDARNEMVYTYNQGVILSGLRGLWEATGNTTYLSHGYRIVRNTIAATGWDLKHAKPRNDTLWHGLGRAGILEEYCDASGLCDQNAHAFKGIYFHHLALFCTPLPRKAASSAMLFTANDGLAKEHRRSCKIFTRWVAHNAQAALNTRDKHGRIGTWWGVHNTIPQSESLPLGAVDYRNNAVGLENTRWSRRVDGRSSGSAGSQRPSKQHTDRLLAHGKAGTSDYNDRGRGRTVESHSGGVAVLRCLYELLALD